MISNKTKKKIVCLTGAMVLGGSLLPTANVRNDVSAATSSVKNVIYLIADGMNDGVLTAARYYKDIQDGQLGNDTLAMDSIRTGFVQTSWANGPITDSAPAGTALSSGYKTNPGVIGYNTNNTPAATVLEAAELSGLSTGIIATSEIMHATPAAFSSHALSRNNYNVLMKQQIYNDMEVVLGGGNAFFQEDGAGKREDGRHLVSEIEQLGYDYITSKDELLSYDGDKLWGMFADYSLAYDFDRQALDIEEPTLAEMTEKAVEVLEKNEDGFFLMVEGSKIDWAAHANDAAGAIGDIIAFDDAVNFAVEYAKEHQDTLVVVTTDHGNSGFSIGNSDTTNVYDNLTFEESIGQLQGLSLSTETFTSLVEGKSDSEISELITKYYGYTGVTQDEINLAKEGKVNQVIAKRAKIGYSTGGHTGGDVYLGVYAPTGVEKLRGIVDNTELPQYIAKNLSLNLDLATEQLFSNVERVATGMEASYEVNEDDKDNPYVIITKDNVELKLHINTDVVEVNVEGKETVFERLSGVTVYNEGTVYGSSEEISTILTKAIENNKAEKPSTPPTVDNENPSDDHKTDKNEIEDTTSRPTTSEKPTNNKKPTTGLQVASGVLGGVAVALIGFKGLVAKKRNK